MSRRRMMMQQLIETDNGIEIPAEYQRNFNKYNITISWSNGVLRLEHTKSGLLGVTSARLSFIGTEDKYAQTTGQAFSANSATLPFLDSTKLYNLTLTAVNVTNNATDSTEDVFLAAIGTRETRYYKEIM